MEAVLHPEGFSPWFVIKPNWNFAVVASEAAKRAHTNPVLIVGAGLQGHCPLVLLPIVFSSRQQTNGALVGLMGGNTSMKGGAREREREFTLNLPLTCAP